MEKWSAEPINDEIIREVAEELNVPVGMVREITSHYSDFIADTIKRGLFETVFIPYFGKFTVKAEEVQWMNHRVGLPVITMSKFGGPTKVWHPSNAEKRRLQKKIDEQKNNSDEETI